MRHGRRRLLVAFGVLLLTFIPDRPVAAECRCSGQSASGDIVFTGVVEEKDDPGRGGAVVAPGRPVTVTFAVDRVVQGTAEQLTTVTTPASEEACGFRFVTGLRYRVMASEGADGGLRTDLCSGNERLAMADPPSESPAPPPRDMAAPEDDALPRPHGIGSLAFLALITVLTTSTLAVAERTGRRRR